MSLRKICLWSVSCLLLWQCGPEENQELGKNGADTQQIAPLAKKAPISYTLTDLLETGSNFSTFTSLAQAAKIDEILKKGEEYTIFAPGDIAFNEVINSEKKMEKMIANSSMILKDHIVKGTWPSNQLKDGQELVTLSGKKIVIQLKDTKVYINKSVVVAADIEASNGVLHALDKTLE